MRYNTNLAVQPRLCGRRETTHSCVFVQFFSYVMSVLLPECIIRIISGFHGVGFEEVSSVCTLVSRLLSSKQESLRYDSKLEPMV